jgi:hypothetical protein
VTIAHVATGARSAGGTTTVSPAYPSGVAAGVLAIASRVIKPNTATGTPEAGWDQQVSATGGTGTTGADVGLTRVVIDTKELVGSESGSVTFDNATTPNSSHGVIQLYSKDSAKAWEILTSSGSDATHGTGRSATGGTTLPLAAGDVVVAVVASDTDATTAWTSPAITASGITFGATTSRLGAGGVATGNQCGLSIFEATVSSGSGTVAPVLTLSGGPSNCGPVAFIRLREVTPPAGQVVFDAVGPSSAGAGAAGQASPLTWSHTCTGADRLLLVGVCFGATVVPTTVAATYNGVAMTELGSVLSNAGTAGQARLFALLAPATGANTVSVTYSGGSGFNSIEAGSVSFAGVEQASLAAAVTGLVTATGNAANPSLAVTSQAGDMVVDLHVNGGSAGTSTKTVRWLKNVNASTGGGNGAQSTAAGAASVTMGYTAAAEWYGILGANVVAASGVEEIHNPYRRSRRASMRR